MFIRSILIIFFFISNLNALESCKWYNNKNKPCLEITTILSNSSEFSKKTVNKIIINKKTIDESGAIDLVDIMKLVSDVNITRSGPVGQQASIFMRGTGSNHTLVMINGVPINDQSTTQGLHDFGVDFIQTIQQIEIYPGSSAAHFGSNAIGGAINIILAGDLEDHFSFFTDKKNNYNFTANKSYVYDNSYFNLKFGQVSHKTISARGNINDEKDGVKNNTINLNYQNYLNDNSRLYFTNYLRQTISEYDNSDINQTGYESDNRLGSFQLGLENFSKKEKRDYLIYYNHYDREYDERGVVDTYKSSVFGLRHDYSTTLNKNFSIGYGTDYKYDYGEFENKGTYEASTKGHTDNISLYGNIGLNIFTNSNISIFTRNDKHKTTGNNLTYKINYQHNLDRLVLGTSYMNGLRNPTLYELYGTDSYGYSGNKNLKPEKSNTYEIYLDYKFLKNIKLSIRSFRSNIKNNIEYVSNKYMNDNDDIDLNQSGVNTKIIYQTNKTNLEIFTSSLSSKKENGAAQLRRPEKNLGINFSKKIKYEYLNDLKFSLNYNHYGKHFDTHSANYNTVKIDSTDLVDLSLSKENKNNIIFLKITNLLNENFQRPHGFNQEQRMLKIGFKY
jgi:vitamin B12 transporter